MRSVEGVNLSWRGLPVLSLGGDHASLRNGAMKFNVNQIFGNSMCLQKNRWEKLVPWVSCRMPFGNRPAVAITIVSEKTSIQVHQVV